MAPTTLLSFFKGNAAGEDHDLASLEAWTPKNRPPDWEWGREVLGDNVEGAGRSRTADYKEINTCITHGLLGETRAGPASYR